MSQTLFEKLEFADEKNLLIQGLPSSIEKQFCKLSFAKNMTPLLRSRKIDFALVFAVNENQLNAILRDVMPALKVNNRVFLLVHSNFFFDMLLSFIFSKKLSPARSR